MIASNLTPSIGALIYGKVPSNQALEWGILPMGVTGQVLTVTQVAVALPNGITNWVTTTAWANPAVPTAMTTFTAAAASFSGAIGVNGATPPVQAAFPGTPDGTAADDATILAKVIAILVNLGFCASS